MLKYILSDIEGTTTNIDFVHKVLFPYFINNINLLDNCSNSEKRNAAYQDIKNTVLKEEGKKLEFVEDVKTQLIHYCKIDRKHPALKTLQGMLWQIAYNNGDLKAHIYPDVVPNFKHWQTKGITLGIYSSGSVLAQHLLFENSVEGNIKGLFSNFYDTQVGHKRDSNSYSNIIKDLGIKASEILFLSDIEEELLAAKQAGISGVLLCREKSNCQSQFFVADTFNGVNNFISSNYGI